MAVYDVGMRTTNRPRPDSGARLAALRKAAGLSQKELAERLGVAPSNIGFWELHDKPPRSDLLPKLAKILGVSVEEILGTKAKPRPTGGPQGRARRVFDELSKLPRRQQSKIVDVVEALVAQSNGNG
jgi:transcriptional regulator with XRE-family HTH domain